ncbi:hypothetical protein ACFRI7_30205 [Streptomyces sp. NPDC056716]|uniref:hypothetical protein n=1 Tax=unclassified Streptomyces TaxID=2593676 RepID=UPI0036A9F82A
MNAADDRTDRTHDGTDEERRRRASADKPVPRDPQDQQATGDHENDPLSVPVPDEPEGRDERAGQVPDTDEAGSGPRGRAANGTVHPEHPEPDEPTD